MKQFSLEEYLKNPSRKVITRNGRNVRIICTDKKGYEYPIVALIENKLEGFEGVLYYTKDGEYIANESSMNDLFFAPEKHEGWVTIHRSSICDGYFTDGIFDSEEKAKERGGAIATVKVEWEE